MRVYHIIATQEGWHLMEPGNSHPVQSYKNVTRAEAHAMAAEYVAGLDLSGDAETQDNDVQVTTGEDPPK